MVRARMPRSSESRTEQIACELLTIRGWSVARPPRGNVLWKNEYRDYPELAEPLRGASKKGSGDGYPDFLVVAPGSTRPLIVGETKADADDAEQAAREACHYANAFADRGLDVLAVGVAGGEQTDVRAVVEKRAGTKWKPIQYRGSPIQWLPTPDETETLLADPTLFELHPRVPPLEVLAKRGDEINRILRECTIKDEYRPAVIGAFMLGVWESKGRIRPSPEYILLDINQACERAFQRAGKIEIADSIMVPTANHKLAAKALRICYILRLLNITTLTAEHDYLGQLYEMFFRFTGGNTIGQFFTPRHVAKFMTDMMEVSPDDFVVDPTCGTGGFLVSSLYRMIGNRHYTAAEIRKLVAKHLRGFESEPITAALCVANMILRGDGTTGIVKGDCFSDKSFPVNECTVALGNPPFPHQKTDTPSEAFVNRALEALRARGKLAMIVPTSLLVKNEKRDWRRTTLAHNTLLGVITLPSELFQPYAASTTAIIVLEKGVPHPPKVETFFCRIENDGYRLKKNVRIPQDGDELPAALEAFENHRSIPGFCSWARVSPNEWAPGAHIEAAAHSDATLKREIEGLFRSLVAFHSLYADRLLAYQRHLDAMKPDEQPRDYRSMTTRPARLLLENRGTIGQHFDVFYGQKELHNKERLQPGPSLVVSSSGMNNGCYGFFDFDNLIAPPFVTVPSTGSIGEAFVQRWPCGVTDDCLLLLPKEGTPLELLYVAAAVCRLERWRFNYGRKITPNRIAGFLLPSSNRLLSWIREGDAQAYNLAHQIVETLDRRGIEARFRELANRWRTEAAGNGTVRHMAMHPAYQQIIGMGRTVVPLILAELEREPDHWFWALHAITGANPVPEDSRGILSKMTEAWLTWGRERGYR